MEQAEMEGLADLAIVPLVFGAFIMMLSLNGPARQLRLRKQCHPAEGTVVDTQQAPATQFEDHKGRSHGWTNGGWCPVYRYQLADGRTLTSAATALPNWQKRKENIVIGEKVALLYNRADPLKIHRGDQPTFDWVDCFFLLLGFALMAAGVFFWPKTGAAAVVVVALYFGWRSGHFGGELAQ
jgi:hypothetical protein